MRCKWLISLGLVVCLVMVFALPMCAPAPPVEEEKPPVEEEKPPVVDEVQEWMKANKVGPYQEKVEDYAAYYDALYQAAKKEGKVVIYSSTSRVPKSVALGWDEKYPGIEVEFIDIESVEGISRIIREQEAGIYAADVCMFSNVPNQVGILCPAHMIAPWVPPELRDVIPQEGKEPAVSHRDSLLGLFWNGWTWDECPVDSWWDLTKPEWKGRLVSRDPRVDASGAQMYMTFVLHGEEFAEDYEREFGKPIELTTPNAAYEWVKMIINNECMFVKKDKEARYIGEPGQRKPSLGIAWETARITDVDNPEYGQIRYFPATDLKPSSGMMYPHSLMIIGRAPHPNAAKLLIHWLFGDEEGGSGIAPWFTPGTWPSRTDIVENVGPAVHPFNPEISYVPADFEPYWYMDPEAIFEIQEEFIDFFNEQIG